MIAEFMAAAGIFAVGYVVGAWAMAQQIKAACGRCAQRKNAVKQGES